ncbi:lipo-like protein, partial [Mesorhizobium sp. M7D.F.Ca.US.004.03.1.1]
LYTPRDFDLSPYFRIVKPTLEYGFDYRQMVWDDKVADAKAPE